jgi:hypothetical protein
MNNCSSSIATRSIGASGNNRIAVRYSYRGACCSARCNCLWVGPCQRQPPQQQLGQNWDALLHSPPQAGESGVMAGWHSDRLHVIKRCCNLDTAFDYIVAI